MVNVWKILNRRFDWLSHAVFQVPSGGGCKVDEVVGFFIPPSVGTGRLNKRIKNLDAHFINFIDRRSRSTLQPPAIGFIGVVMDFCWTFSNLHRFPTEKVGLNDRRPPTKIQSFGHNSRMNHPMSWLAVTFTTQEINSLRPTEGWVNSCVLIEDVVDWPKVTSSIR